MKKLYRVTLPLRKTEVVERLPAGLDERSSAVLEFGEDHLSARVNLPLLFRLTTQWLLYAAFVCLVIALVPFARAQSSDSTSGPMVIDASAPTEEVKPAQYDFIAADAVSNDGHRLGVNARYLTLDEKPWLPVMGEMHYSRVPEAEWEEQILKMKSAGVEIVAAYIIWIHHEEIQGQWEWNGDKDLRHFVELCAKHGMYVVPRIGPWSHAEVRNGGFPDWLLKSTVRQRTNDPAYLKYVDAFYKQIGAQLKGLMWKDGGPVIAVQLENEYRGRGALEHILTLKKMALDAGLHVPFFTVTGWDGAVVPVGEVLPVYGGYPDAPWDASLSVLPAPEVYAFRFGSRVTGDMGAQNGEQKSGATPSQADTTPFMTAEMGGGMQVTYHRRPVVSADDVAAMMPVMLGSGVNLYGTYMFQGGENPDGKLTTLQESLATHAPNDLPVKTYDFEAPLGEFGDERPSLMKLKSWNYFLNDFGAELAPMVPHRPQVLPTNRADLSVARISVRSAGESGFLFVNNHMRNHVMPPRTRFQVSVKLPEGRTLIFPEKPVTLPTDSYFVWPFHETLAGLHLRYATAQPLAKLGSGDAPVFAFFAQPGIPAEFVVEDEPGLKVDRIAGVERRNGAIWIRGITPGIHAQVRFTLNGGKTVTLLLLRQEDAERSWRVKSGNFSALVLTPQQAFVNGDEVTLNNFGTDAFSTQLVPADHLKLAVEGDNSQAGAAGKGAVNLPLVQTQQATEIPPMPAGFKPSSKPRVVAAAPVDSDWQHAAIWRVALPTTKPEPGTQTFLRIDFTGDVARLSAGDHLLTDDFWDGRSWLIGLTRFQPELTNNELKLSIYPLRSNAPIFFERGTKLPSGNMPAAELRSIQLVTEYTQKLHVVAIPAVKH